MSAPQPVIKYSIMTYNVFLTVPKPIRHTGQMNRATRIKEALRPLVRDVDVIIFTELNIDVWRRRVVMDMKRLGFRYHTSKERRFPSLLSSGIVVCSRHPIVRCRRMYFRRSCAGSDCLASKGVVYTKVRKGGRCIHVFGVHLQAWQFPTVRAAQIQKLEEFVRTQRIKPHHPVFIGGDFNVNLNEEPATHQTWLYTPQLSADSLPNSVDPALNSLVGTDEPSAYDCKRDILDLHRCTCCQPESLDFVAWHAMYSQPQHATTEYIRPVVRPFRLEYSLGSVGLSTDISDHFPCISRFTYDKPATRTTQRRKHDMLSHGIRFAIQAFFEQWERK